jgi:shikimate dehydrogenase
VPISGRTRLVGLIGKPVSGSLSPRMQNAAFAALGLDWVYVTLPVEPEDVEAALRGLAALGFSGANVTIPHKVAVAELCDELAGGARRAQSVNTIVVDGRRRLVGSSTDAAVLANVRSERAIVLGAGGAARPFVAMLEDTGTRVRIFSRHGDWPPDPTGADLIVNATPIVDEVPVAATRGQTVIDLPYRPDGSPTALVEASRAAGARVLDGREVLVWQGAAAFERWTGVPAPVEVMRSALGLPA